MTVADYIAQLLHARGVERVFDLSGGMIAHVLDAIHRRGATRVVSMHHEQSAAFAADASGRMSGVPGVALATGGPGATNLLTGIASCYFDSSPAVFITGQVHRRDQKGELGIRQLGFQETDIVSMAGAVTKAAWPARSPEEVPELLARAFDLAVAGRPGPVLVDIPLDVQWADVDAGDERWAADGPTAVAAIAEAIPEKVLERLARAERPLIWVGGGVRAARATDLLRAFVSRVRVPVVCTLMGLDALPSTDPLRVGFVGSYGNRWANLAAGASDVMLVLGARLDIRQTGSDTRSFKGDRTIFQVDCEAAEMNNRVTGCEAIEADLADFLAAALEGAQARDLGEHSAWLAEIDELRRRHPDTEETTRQVGINPNVLMHQISRASASAAAYAVDVGQHQMWAAQSLQLRADQRLLTSGGLGSMGFALPAAIGAALAVAPRPVVVIAGDGGFQCNLQELESVVRNRMALKIVVVNNRCHGMTRQFQESFFGERYQSSLWGYSAPDFARLAIAYGIEARSVQEQADVDQAIEWLWSDPEAPALLDVRLHTFVNLYPKIAFGRPITEMEPAVEPLPEWTAAQDESSGEARAAPAGRAAEAAADSGDSAASDPAVPDSAGALRTSSTR